MINKKDNILINFCLACEADARRRRHNFPAAAVGAAAVHVVVSSTPGG